MKNTALPANLAVLTTRQILVGKENILLVTHDSDDGGWQFLPAKQITTADVSVVALAEIVELDASVLGVLDLPTGWRATRSSHSTPWVKAPQS